MAEVMDLERGRPARVRARGPRSDTPADVLLRIVVVGGGAAGLELVTRLGDRLGRAQVRLVEPARTHLWKPLLHEVAAGRASLPE
jgi:NADH:ubiquinone reductase (H+-translocating)